MKERLLIVRIVRAPVSFWGFYRIERRLGGLGQLDAIRRALYCTTLIFRKLPF